MAPPFIAYYGAMQCEPKGDALLQTAYEQVKLYREVLFDKQVGLWRHIALGNGTTDPTHWATGNAWAAAGALRVLATIRHSRAGQLMRSQQKDLMKWVGETLDGVWKFQVGISLSLSYPFVPKFRIFPLKIESINPPPLAESKWHTPELHQRARLILGHVLHRTLGRVDFPLCADRQKRYAHPRGDSCVATDPRERR